MVNNYSFSFSVCFEGRIFFNRNKFNNSLLRKGSLSSSTMVTKYSLNFQTSLILIQCIHRLIKYYSYIVFHWSQSIVKQANMFQLHLPLCAKQMNEFKFTWIIFQIIKVMYYFMVQKPQILVTLNSRHYSFVAKY